MSFLTNFLNETKKAGQYDKNKGLLSNFSSQMGRSVGLVGKGISSLAKGVVKNAPKIIQSTPLIPQPVKQVIKPITKLVEAKKQTLQTPVPPAQAKKVEQVQSIAPVTSLPKAPTSNPKIFHVKFIDDFLWKNKDSIIPVLQGMEAKRQSVAPLKLGTEMVSGMIGSAGMAVDFVSDSLPVNSKVKEIKDFTEGLKAVTGNIASANAYVPSKKWQEASKNNPESLYKDPDLIKESIRVVLPSVTSSLAMALLPGGMAVLSAATADDIKSTAMKHGMSEGKATLAATTAAIPIMILDRIGLGKAVGKLSPKFAKSFAGKLFERVLMEGATEIGQEKIQIIAEEALGELSSDEQKKTRYILAGGGGLLGGTMAASPNVFYETTADIVNAYGKYVNNQEGSISENTKQVLQSLLPKQLATQTASNFNSPVMEAQTTDFPSDEPVLSSGTSDKEEPIKEPQEIDVEEPAPVYETYEGNLEEAQITPINQATGTGKILSAAKDAGDLSAYKMIIEKVEEPRAGTGVDGFAYRATILDPQGKIISNNSYVRNEDIPSIAADKFEVNIKDIIKTRNSVVPVYEVPQEVRLEDTEEIIQKREEIKKKYNARKLARKQGSQYNQEQPPVLADSDVSYTPQSPEPAPLQETQQDTTFKLSPQVAALFTPQAQTEAPIEATTELPALDSGTPVKQPSIEEQLADTTPTDLQGTTDITEDESQFLPEGPVYYPGGFSIGEENVDTFADPNIPVQEISALEAVTGPNALRENPSLDPSSEEAQPALYKFVKGVVSSFKLSDKAKEEVMNALFPVKVAEVLALAEHPSITPEDVAELEDALKYIKIKSTLKIDNVLTSPEFTSFSTTSDARKKMYAGMMDAARADGNKLFKVYSRIQEKLNPVEEPVVEEDVQVDSIPEEVVETQDSLTPQEATTDVSLNDIFGAMEEIEQQRQVNEVASSNTEKRKILSGLGKTPELLTRKTAQAISGDKEALKDLEKIGFDQELQSKASQEARRAGIFSMILPSDTAKQTIIHPKSKSRDIAREEADRKKTTAQEDVENVDVTETTEGEDVEQAIPTGTANQYADNLSINTGEIVLLGEKGKSVQPMEVLINLGFGNESDMPTLIENKYKQIESGEVRNDLIKPPSIPTTELNQVIKNVDKSGWFTTRKSRPRKLENTYDFLFGTEDPNAGNAFHDYFSDAILTVNPNAAVDVMPEDTVSNPTPRIIEALKKIDELNQEVLDRQGSYSEYIRPVVDIRTMSANAIRDFAVEIINNKIKFLPAIRTDYNPTQILSKLAVPSIQGDRMVPLSHIFDSIPFTFISETPRTGVEIGQELIKDRFKEVDGVKVPVPQAVSPNIFLRQNGVSKEFTQAAAQKAVTHLQLPLNKEAIFLTYDGSDGNDITWDIVNQSKAVPVYFINQLSKYIANAKVGNGSSLKIFITPELFETNLQGESTKKQLLGIQEKLGGDVLRRWDGKKIPKEYKDNQNFVAETNRDATPSKYPDPIQILDTFQGIGKNQFEVEEKPEKLPAVEQSLIEKGIQEQNDYIQQLELDEAEDPFRIEQFLDEQYIGNFETLNDELDYIDNERISIADAITENRSKFYAYKNGLAALALVDSLSKGTIQNSVKSDSLKPEPIPQLKEDEIMEMAIRDQLLILAQAAGVDLASVKSNLPVYIKNLWRKIPDFSDRRPYLPSPIEAIHLFNQGKSANEVADTLFTNIINYHQKGSELELQQIELENTKAKSALTTAQNEARIKMAAEAVDSSSKVVDLKALQEELKKKSLILSTATKYKRVLDEGKTIPEPEFQEFERFIKSGKTVQDYINLKRDEIKKESGDLKWRDVVNAKNLIDPLVKRNINYVEGNQARALLDILSPFKKKPRSYVTDSTPSDESILKVGRQLVNKMLKEKKAKNEIKKTQITPQSFKTLLDKLK